MTDSKDKQVIKNLQAKTDIIYKMEDKASKVLVLTFGSSSIKMGFANQKIPFQIKPFIAYRKFSKEMEENQREMQNEQEINTELFKNEYMNIQNYLKNECIISSEHRPTKGKPRGKQVISLQSFPNLEEEENDFLYGDEALTVEDCPEQYIFKKVLKFGQLNVKDDSIQSLNESINDMEKLLCYLMKEKLKIPENQWKTFSCIISIPDVFIRPHVKNLISMIFNKIGFNKIYVHLESILACLGTAVSSAVVVDIGHQKINICCVDEGVILPKTLVRKNFGMKNVSKILIKLFKNKILEPQCQLSTRSECDLAQIDQIKQLGCAVRQPEQNSNKVYEIKTRRNKQEISLQVNYNDALCVAANSIFFNIWNAFERQECFEDAFNSRSILYALAPDPDDIFEQYSGGGQIYEIDDDNPMYSKEIADPFVYSPLDELVVASLMGIKDVEMRKKFLTNILVVGGGGMLPQFSDQLVKRLSARFQAEGVEEKAQIATDLILRQINGAHASLLGGTVLPKLDYLRDLWIEKNKFIGCMKEEMIQIEEQGGILDKKLFTRKQESQQWGLRYLKQKIPFLW